MTSVFSRLIIRLYTLQSTRMPLFLHLVTRLYILVKVKLPFSIVIWRTLNVFFVHFYIILLKNVKPSLMKIHGNTRNSVNFCWFFSLPGPTTGPHLLGSVSSQELWSNFFYQTRTPPGRRQRSWAGANTINIRVTKLCEKLVRLINEVSILFNVLKLPSFLGSCIKMSPAGTVVF